MDGKVCLFVCVCVYVSVSALCLCACLGLSVPASVPMFVHLYVPPLTGKESLEKWRADRFQIIGKRRKTERK